MNSVHYVKHSVMTSSMSTITVLSHAFCERGQLGVNAGGKVPIKLATP